MINSEDVDESEGKKRDWKDEKEEIKIKSEKTEDEKAEDTETKVENPVIVEDFTTKEAKETSEKSEKESVKTCGKKSEARHAESRYAEVPMSHMFCHICNKHMWDGFVCIMNKFI